MRAAIISMPVCALMTTAAVSTASSAPIAWPMKSGKPGVSIRWMRVFGGFEMHQRRAQRMLVRLLERIEVADGAAALDAAGRRDRARLGEQRLGERRLARRTITYQRYSTNVFRRELRHGGLLEVRWGECTAEARRCQPPRATGSRLQRPPV